MAEEWSDFEPVFNGQNNKLENGLPNEGTVQAFRYRKVFDSFFPFGALQDGSVATTVRGSWTIRIHENGQKDVFDQYTAPILFEQTVEIRFLVVVQSFGGGVGFFFWSPIDGGDGRVTTTRCDNQPVPIGENGKPEGWKFVDTPRPTIYSEEGDVRAGEFDDNSDDLDATSDFTAQGGRIWGAFQSAAYRCTIPPGAVLDVVTDNWQFATLREATYLFSFKGAPEFAAILDWTNALRMASPQSGGAFIEHRYTRGGKSFGPNRARSFLPGISQMHLAKTADNALWILGNEATVGRLWLSEDDGTTRQKASYKTPTGEKKDVIVFGAGYKMLDLKTAPDGRMWALAEKNNKLWVCSSSDNWQKVTEIGAVKAGAPYRLGMGLDGAILIAAIGHEYEWNGTGKAIERPVSNETATT